MNVVAVSTQDTALDYLFTQSFPTTLTKVSKVKYLSGWVDVIKGKGCGMLVKPTQLAACF
jgi:hypothetical protein